MEVSTLVCALEAVLFASSEPVSFARLEEVFGSDGVSREELRTALDTLQQSYAGHGVEVREIGGGFQLRTRQEMAPWLTRLEVQRAVRVSRAAMEALTIVAYRQPLTRAEVEEVRGVDCGGVLKSLLEKGLIRIVGKKDVPGRPLLYGTTPKFLEVFGLSSLTELPSLRDVREIVASQAEGVTEVPPSEGAQPAEGGAEVAE